MFLDQNPLTSTIHEYQRDKIIQKFPQISNEIKIPLIFWNFLTKRPEKYYSNEIFDITLNTFKKFLLKYPDELLNFSNIQKYEFNKSFRQLMDINALKIHDNILSKEEIDLIEFCDNAILPAYLKLIEGVFHVLIKSIIAFNQLEKGKSITDLDLYNQIENLKGKYEIFIESASVIMRNGIAHGGVLFGTRDISFIDKKGNQKEYRIKDVISKFDDLLDTCNAISLAYLVFYYENYRFFTNNNVVLPINLICEEIKSELKSPGWEVNDCIESQIFEGKTQFNIFTTNSFLYKPYLIYHIGRTMHISNIYAPYYDRYLIKLISKHYLNGFIVFDGNKILELQKNMDEDDSNAYFKAIKLSCIWHRDMPFQKLCTLIIACFSGLIIRYFLEKEKLKEKKLNLIYEPRTVELSIEPSITKARVSIVINISPNIEIDKIVRKNISNIIKNSIRYAKKDLSYFSLSKYLPISFIHINVLTKDFRKRNIQYPGFIPELLCIIQQDKTKKIKKIDIATGIPEMIGDIRIVWNTKSGYPKD
jgi:hypothetical protein